MTRGSGFWRSVVSSPSGSGGGARPPTILVHFGRERTTLVVLKISYFGKLIVVNFSVFTRQLAGLLGSEARLPRRRGRRVGGVWGEGLPPLQTTRVSGGAL